MTQQSQRHSILAEYIPWIHSAILVVVCLALYAHTSSYGYTDLDDTIFIREFENFNRQDSSYLHSFARGVFSDSNDTYYRPLLLASFVVDRHREGKLTRLLHTENLPSDSISAYHWTNIILHVTAVVLLYFLLRSLLNNTLTALILSLIFAVHPIVMQAVTWIPGRNDSLLAVFVFGFTLCVQRYVLRRSFILAVAQVLLLLLALFTKETGIIAAPVALYILLVHQRVRWNDRSLLIAAASWVTAIAVWILVRSYATVKNQDVGLLSFLSSIADRSPVVLQYLGKVFLPFNLAVVPYQDQTTIWYGVAAVVIVLILIFTSRQRDWFTLSTGFVWFILFLLPVLVVPKSLNREIYEHRMYLPLVGLLLVIGSTDIFKRFSQRTVMIAGGAIVALLFIVSYNRTELFSSKIAFWESAVGSSPKSAYCTMMLGARYYMDKVNPRPTEGEQLILRAYALDSTEKYINYYMGKLMWDKDKIAESERYFLRELEKNPRWDELYFRLARCAIERRDLSQGQQYLETYNTLNPMDPQGVNNLLMVYIDNREWHKARSFATAVRSRGMSLSGEMIATIERGFQTDSANSTTRP